MSRVARITVSVSTVVSDARMGYTVSGRRSGHMVRDEMGCRVMFGAMSLGKVSPSGCKGLSCRGVVGTGKLKGLRL